MSDDLTTPTELTQRRVTYAATVAKLQLQTARQLAKEITKTTENPSDPLVLALFQVIASNYSALVVRP